MRWTRMNPFVDHYKNITAAYVPETISGTPPPLSSRYEIFAILQVPKDSPDTKRSELTSTHFTNRGGRTPALGVHGIIEDISQGTH